MKTLRKKTKSAGEYSTDEQRWRAVMRRDANAVGKFFYSVRTTRVFCHPNCGARRPNRNNVAFHDSCEAAELSGFRPCKRCRPNDERLAKVHAATIAVTCRRIISAEEPLSLETIAKSVGISPFHFHRLFKKITGLTPKAYAKAHRAEQARLQLSKSTSVTRAIYNSGFNSSSRFYEKSAQLFGMKPKKFNKGGAGTTIRFAVGECSLGSILVASSEKGICEISLGDDPNELVKKFQEHFPNANLVGGDKKFERVVARVIGFVEAPQIGLDLPLDVRGTAFQQRVWDALQKIPVGTTVSYSQIAERLGIPRAVRAVASAIASNNVAVAIPCHRVVHRDGSISGFRWGVERKRLLLKREQGK